MNKVSVRPYNCVDYCLVVGPLISPSEMDRLSNLHSLALDFSDLTSELCGLLASPRRTPLHRLSLLLNGAALEFKPLEGTATEDDWKALVRQHLCAIVCLVGIYTIFQDLWSFSVVNIWRLSHGNWALSGCDGLLIQLASSDWLKCWNTLQSTIPDPHQVRRSANLRVYIMALEVDSTELLRVLKPSLPLERLHLDSYSALVTDATLELISQQYNKTLAHFLLLRDDPDFPDLSVNRNEDPLVLLAWRCTQLAVLVIHGEMSLSFNKSKRIWGFRVGNVLIMFEFVVSRLTQILLYLH